MLPEKLPKPSEWCPQNDPQNEQEWEEYFECRKRCDRDLSQEIRDKLDSAILELDSNDERFIQLGKLNPLVPDCAYRLKKVFGLKSLQEFNLIDAKHKYPDEF